jgi:hypothetical protein
MARTTGLPVGEQHSEDRECGAQALAEQ